MSLLLTSVHACILSLFKVADDEFWVWDSSNPNKAADWPFSEIPRYRMVRTVTLKRIGGIWRLNCDCAYPQRIGLPCSCILRVARHIELNMCHPRYLKEYELYYGRPTELGRKLVELHVQANSHSQLGVPVSPDMVEDIQSCTDVSSYPR